MLQLKNDVLQAQVNPFGAELHSVVLAGAERLWQGDPAVWSGRAPVLFPVAGAFLHGQYTYAGKTYAMPQHGFARKRAFQVTAQDARSVSLLLDSKEENYPFACRLFVSFALPAADTGAIRVTYRVENAGDEAMYYGLGAHEAYACPEGIEHCQVVFSADDVLRQGVLSGAQLTHETVERRLTDRTLPLGGECFIPDAMVFSGLASRSVTLKNTVNSRTVRVDFPDFPHLLLWQKPDAAFLAIEPWLNPPEFTDHDGQLIHKPGIQRLAPGEGREYVHTITFG